MSKENIDGTSDKLNFIETFIVNHHTSIIVFCVCVIVIAILFAIGLNIQRKNNMKSISIKSIVISIIIVILFAIPTLYVWKLNHDVNEYKKFEEQFE